MCLYVSRSVLLSNLSLNNGVDEGKWRRRSTNERRRRAWTPSCDVFFLRLWRYVRLIEGTMTGVVEDGRRWWLLQDSIYIIPYCLNVPFAVYCQYLLRVCSVKQFHFFVIFIYYSIAYSLFSIMCMVSSIIVILCTMWTYSKPCCTRWDLCCGITKYYDWLSTSSVLQFLIPCIWRKDGRH
jgi:hypothetical protein